MHSLYTFLKKHYKAVLILAAAAAVLLLSHQNSPSVSYTEETVRLRDITTYNSFVGNVESSAEYELIPKASGTVSAVYVSEGDYVNEGQILLELDHSSVDYSISLKEASIGQTATQYAYNIKDAEKTYQDYKDTLEAERNQSLLSAQNQKDTTYGAWKDAEAVLNDAVSQRDNGTDSAVISAASAADQAQSAYEAVIAAGQKETAEAALNEANAVRAQAEQQYEAALEALSEEDRLSAQTDPSAFPEIMNAKTALEAAILDADNKSAGLENAVREIAEAEAALNNAKDAYETAREALDSRIQTLEKQLDDAWCNWEKARINYESVEMQVNQQLQTYANNLEKTQANANLYSSELELKHLKDSLKDYRIEAPVAGTVTALNVKVGSAAGTAQPAVVISNLKVMHIAIKVDEYSILKVKEGSEVTIYIDSINRSYSGTISRIADTASVEGGVSYFTAEVQFSGDEDVRSGMSVEVRLITADEKNVLSVSNNAVFYSDDNMPYVLLKTVSGREEQRFVETGKTDGTYVQIVSGLNEGDTVLLDRQTDMISSPYERRGPGSMGE